MIRECARVVEREIFPARMSEERLRISDGAERGERLRDAGRERPRDAGVM
jgi:hypothetical protein